MTGNVDKLVTQLKDANPAVRRRAIILLGRMRDKRAVEPLLEALEKDQDRVFDQLRNDHRAAIALAEIGDSRAIEPLIKRLNDSHVYGVDKIVVAKFGERAVEPLVQSLVDPVTKERTSICSWAKDVFAMIGKPATGPLVELLEYGGEGARVYHEVAIKALGMIGDKRALESLVRQLARYPKLWEWHLFPEIVKSLERLGDDRAVAPLVNYFPDYYVENAVKSLVTLEPATSEALTASLLARADVFDEEVRFKALELLFTYCLSLEQLSAIRKAFEAFTTGSQGKKDGTPTTELTDLFESDPFIKRLADEDCWTGFGTRLSDLHRAVKRNDHRSYNALMAGLHGETGGRPVNYLVMGSLQGPLEQRLLVLDILTVLITIESVTAMVAMLTSTEEEVRIKAAISLAALEKNAKGMSFGTPVVTATTRATVSMVTSSLPQEASGILGFALDRIFRTCGEWLTHPARRNEARQILTGLGRLGHYRAFETLSRMPEHGGETIDFLLEYLDERSSDDRIELTEIAGQLTRSGNRVVEVLARKTENNIDMAFTAARLLPLIATPEANSLAVELAKNYRGQAKTSYRPHAKESLDAEVISCYAESGFPGSSFEQVAGTLHGLGYLTKNEMVRLEEKKAWEVTTSGEQASSDSRVPEPPGKQVENEGKKTAARTVTEDFPELEEKLAPWGEFLAELLVNNPDWQVYGRVRDRIVEMSRSCGLTSDQRVTLLERPLQAAVKEALLAGPSKGEEEAGLVLEACLKVLEGKGFVEPARGHAKEGVVDERLLKQLRLRSLDLAMLPESIGMLDKLVSLDLGDNQLRSLPDFIGQLEKLQTLKLAGNQLRSLPETAGNLTDLDWLDLSENQLSALPDSFGQLEKLQMLMLSKNQLSALSDSIGQLKNLRTLYLNGNQLSSFPESLLELTGLQTLDLGENRLSSLPDSFGQLKNLQTLYLSKNQLSVLPDSFDQLKNLRELRLYNNQLSALPDSFGQLKNLRRLSLFGNQLSALPDSFGNLSNLRELKLHGNQLDSRSWQLVEILEKRGCRVVY